ncbi:hypothetical protein CEQ48_17770 [Vibrio tarriae]|uniref:Oligosaccharide repeat unit polymerase n=1 Tax=Vibrio tarriae TaxID=2014742 RepID=A0AAU8WX66_9VIBR|nr:O-antigen polymerase [Vibrio tarriae]ASK56500.1 hypothetical protein CEQ48_17770 [Vibrio tarriae]
MMDNVKYLPSAMLFFLFGFFYYLILPVVSIHFLGDNRQVEIVQTYVDSALYGEEYYMVSIFGLLFFYFFLKFGEKIKFRAVSIGQDVCHYKLTPIIISLILLFILFVSTIKGVMDGVVLFSGYSDYNISILGPYATTVFCSVIFVNYFESRKNKFIFLSIFLISSVLLLGLGSRMFFLLGAISLLLNIICVNPRVIRSPLFIFSIFSIFILVLVVGGWRSKSDINLDGIVGIFIAEPLFTSVSSVNYFKSIDDFFVFKFPYDIIASIFNFTPSILMPNKGDLVDSIAYDIKEYSPFGASSLLVNVHINFGVLFFIYFSLIGFVFGFMKSLAKKNKLFYAIYLSSLPLLMFHFFREGFITYIKVQFFNAIIMPLLLVSILGFLLRSIRD